MEPRPATATLLPIRVTPRSGRNAVTGNRAGVVQISVTAPPAEGAANEAVLEVLREALHCRKSALCVHRGHKSRDKVIAVSGMDAAEVAAKLSP